MNISLKDIFVRVLITLGLSLGTIDYFSFCYYLRQRPKVFDINDTVTWVI